jgi:hypothetical protein
VTERASRCDLQLSRSQFCIPKRCRVVILRLYTADLGPAHDAELQTLLMGHASRPPGAAITACGAKSRFRPDPTLDEKAPEFTAATGALAGDHPSRATKRVRSQLGLRRLIQIDGVNAVAAWVRGLPLPARWALIDGACAGAIGAIDMLS